jgi:mycofactocin system FadH/OYE family oxidoreductase 2
MSQFKYLFSPLKIGSVTVPNRIVFSAHLTNLSENNLVGDRLVNYYAERAKGGCGLIITEEQSVHPTDHAYEPLIHAFHEEVIPGYKKLTQAVHNYGAKVFSQINHNGMQCSGMYSRLPVWGPSPVYDPIHREMPKEMEAEDIKEVLDGYVKVIGYVKEGGFDGAELQSSHSSLLRQFFSPHTNRRTDKYGGSLENRMRFVLELIEALRAAVGREYVIGIRLCGDELVPGGLTLKDICDIAVRLEKTGLFDYINTSIGEFHHLYMVEGSMHTPPGYQLYISSAIRQVVNLPVFATGRIKDPVQAEQVLVEGHADMVGAVRAQISDPEFGIKAREGRIDEIRLCLSCNQECIGKMGINLPLGCIQNPAVGKEKILGTGTIKLTPKRKRVAVIGGGPAGLETAKNAALRGHQVVIYEKKPELGGQVNLAVKVSNRAEFGDIVRNQLNILHTLANVEYKLGVDVTADMLTRENFDTVVVATGSHPGPRYLPGAHQDHVLDVWQVLQNEKPIGQHVVIIDGVGFHQATSVAEWLAESGRKVEFLTGGLYAGGDLGLTLDLEMWISRVRKLGIKLTPNVYIQEIGSNYVQAANNYSGQGYRVENVANVVLALPNIACDNLYHELKGKVKELYRVGDCIAPRRAQAAVYDGTRVGREI